jgi:hypothetical protein
MTVSYDFVNIPSSPTRIDIPRLDQSKILQVSDTISIAKNGIATVVNEFVLTGSDVLQKCEIQQRVETRPALKQFEGGIDRGSVSAFSLRLSTPMSRSDSVTGLTVTEDATVTIAVSLPMGTTDLDGLMDFVSAAFGLVVDSIDGTSHEPLTDNLFSLVVGAKPW